MLYARRHGIGFASRGNRRTADRKGCRATRTGLAGRDDDFHPREDVTASVDLVVAEAIFCEVDEAA